MKQPYLIRIVDDDPSVVESLQFMLEMAGLQVKSYDGAETFLQRDDPKREGCLLLDVRMPGMTGLELQHRMRGLGNDLPIVFLSAHGDIRMAVQAVQEGAVDFLVKPPQTDELLAVLRRACSIHAERRRLDSELLASENVWSSLTSAEQDTAELIAKGLTNRETASVLGISEETVRSRRSSILAKLEAVNAVEIADFLHERNTLREKITWR